MRPLLIALALAAAACGGEGAASEAQALSGSVRSIVTPVVTIGPGEEKFICFATSLPTDTEIGVKRWSSKMTPGSHHMIVYASDEPWAPDGTVKDCPALSLIAAPSKDGKSRPPVWAYASQEASAELPSPPGVGVVLRAGQHLIVNLHYLNASAKPLEAHAEINVEAYAPGEEYIPAASIATYNTQIQIPPKGKQTVEGACDVPAGAKFFALSTHSHRYTKRATVSDGDRVLADTSDWEHPALVRFEAPFVELTTGKLSYRCDYDNPTDQVITTGESAEKNEMCMGVGYIFPAKSSSFCVNSTIVRGGQ